MLKPRQDEEKRIENLTPQTLSTFNFYIMNKLMNIFYEFFKHFVN